MGKQFDGCEDWQLLSATSQVILPSRWKYFWQYVLLGKGPETT